MQFSPLPTGMRQPCDKPGTLVEMTYQTHTYDDANAPLTKRVLVYLPHGCGEDPARRYPVLYLMHGGGGDENEVFGGIEGSGPLRHVLDNAIACGHAAPFIVVAPTYTVEGMEAARQSIDVAVKLTHRFPTELVRDLIPAVDAAFPTIADRRARAFSGFSMGGETTWSVAAEAMTDLWCCVPLSGDYWAMGLKGGKDFPEETADIIVDRIRQQGIAPDECRIMAFTGDKDIAFEALQPQMDALARRTDFFTPAEMPADGNLTWCLKRDGWHTYDDCWEYLWLAMPYLFG
ncbi:MAG: hypothetical protein IJE07_05080 [Clostridia bacterium]|nr:hypothetical protein [Clostridia bacterium]